MKAGLDQFDPELKDIIDEGYNRLSNPAAKMAFERILLEMATKGHSALFTAYATQEYDYLPVDMETFLDEPEFLGKKGQIWPAIKEDLIEFFDGPYFLALMDGAIGFGKSTFSELALTRLLYDMLAYKNPQQKFGLMEGSHVALVNISVNYTQAKRVVYETVRSLLRRSPFFKTIHYQDLEKELRFEKEVWLAPASATSTAALGYNIVGGVMDEVNWLPIVQSKGAEVKDYAQAIFDITIRRIKSRPEFIFTKDIKPPAKLIVISANRHEKDFTSRLKEQYQGKPDVFIRTRSQWETRPKGFFPPERFAVCLGYESMQPRILESCDGCLNQMIYLDIQKCPVRKIKVPAVYRDEFERDIWGALRDLAGIATVGVNLFIKDRQRFLGCLDQRPHPFTLEQTTLQDKGAVIWEHITKTENVGGVRKTLPSINSQAPRYIHVDLSKTQNPTGFAMGHCAGFKEVKRMREGIIYEETLPITYIDFMLRIIPPPGGEISYTAIMSLIKAFRAHGFVIGCVSADQFQSTYFLQQCQEIGIATMEVSVDRTPEPYIDFKNAVLDRRVVVYQYRPFKEEVLALIEDPDTGKIDHPEAATKDVADAVASITHLITVTAKATKRGVGVRVIK